MPVTAIQLKTMEPREKDFKVYDEKGLYVLVKTNGGKYWRLKYRHGEKNKTMALGVYPEVSLKEARLKRDDARKLIASGIDPVADRREKKTAALVAQSNSFEQVSREWFAIKQADKSEAHKFRCMRLLERELLPYIGNRPVNEITAPELLSVLRRTESRGVFETTHRAKQTAGQVFQYAIITGKAERNPAKDLAGALKTAPKSHFSAITSPQEAARLMQAIHSYSGSIIVRAALQLSPLVFLRPKELRHLEWKEINWSENRIDIPAEKMKMKQDHAVPLSVQSREIIEGIKPLTGRCKYIFPSERGNSRCLSENTVRVAIRTLGFGKETMTAHGFRAMARTMLDEQLGYRLEWIEQQLAHEVKDMNGRAYNRTMHLEGRIKMMQHWADYLDELRLSLDSAAR